RTQGNRAAHSYGRCVSPCAWWGRHSCLPCTEGRQECLPHQCCRAVLCPLLLSVGACSRSAPLVGSKNDLAAPVPSTPPWAGRSVRSGFSTWWGRRDACPTVLSGIPCCLHDSLIDRPAILTFSVQPSLPCVEDFSMTLHTKLARHTNRRAFTLMEMLIVVAII